MKHVGRYTISLIITAIVIVIVLAICHWLNVSEFMRGCCAGVFGSTTMTISNNLLKDIE